MSRNVLLRPTRVRSRELLNAKYAESWPNLAVKRELPADAKEFDGISNKREKYFSPNPGQGDAAAEEWESKPRTNQTNV
jgi:ferredoxin